MKSGGRCDNILVTNLTKEKGPNLVSIFARTVEQLPKIKIDPEHALVLAVIGGGFILGPLCIGAIAVSEWLK